MTTAVILFFVALQLAAQPATSPAPSEGSGTVEVVLYSDFQCPYCAQFAAPFRELETKGVKDVNTKVTFKHFPLAMHPKARLAHQAAAAAGDQGKFWEMHDLLFADPKHLERDDLVAHAEKIGLDVARFREDLESDRVKALVAKDIAEGESRQINGTPTFYINGRQYVGARSYGQLAELIHGEMRSARAIAEIPDSLLSRGRSSAPVTLELYADLQSPVTRPALEVIDEVLRRHPSDVRLQFRSFPLAFHPDARLAHEAAMVAARADRFWEFVNYALNHQDSLREQDLLVFAGRLGLDQAALAENLRERRYAPRVDADLRKGNVLGLRGSPVILVNGKRIDGVPSLDTLTGFVNAELSAGLSTPVKKH